MRLMVVGMADCRVSAVPDDVLVTYALGSCVGLTVHDPVAGVGGMLHFMLPDSRVDPERGKRNPYAFADTGIPLLLKHVRASGGVPGRLWTCAVGAAQILEDSNLLDIGNRNYQAARRILWKLGILLSGEAVGGTEFRSLRLEVGTGTLMVEQAGSRGNSPRSWRPKGGIPCPIGC